MRRFVIWSRVEGLLLFCNFTLCICLNSIENCGDPSSRYRDAAGTPAVRRVCSLGFPLLFYRRLCLIGSVFSLRDHQTRCPRLPGKPQTEDDSSSTQGLHFSSSDVSVSVLTPASSERLYNGLLLSLVIAWSRRLKRFLYKFLVTGIDFVPVIFQF